MVDHPDVVALQEQNRRGECATTSHVLGVAYGGLLPFEARSGVCGRCGDKLSGEEATRLVVAAYAASIMEAVLP